MVVSSGQQSRRERKRAEIVAVAKALFFREGYAGASMAQIAARVGGSKATLYNHFASKEELLLAVVKDVADPATMAATGEQAPAAFRPWLLWLARVAIRALSSEESISMQRLAAAEAARFPEIGRIFYEDAIKPGHLILSARFQAAMEAGEIRKADPLEATEAFLDVCAGGWPQRRLLWNIGAAPDKAETERRAKQAVKLFMDGYAPR